MTDPQAMRERVHNTAAMILAQKWIEECGLGNHVLAKHYVALRDAIAQALADAESRAVTGVIHGLCRGCREGWPFHKETENYHVHPTHGRGAFCNATRVRAIRALKGTPRERLQAAIAEKDRQRGRPLTAFEKLRNLSRALYGDDRMLPPEKPAQAGE